MHTSDLNLPISLRPVLVSDIDMYRAFLAELSPGTVYFRFGRLSTPAFTDEQLREICSPDPRKLVSFVATTNGLNAQRIVGTARMEHDIAANAWEFTIVVSDEFQGNGLGRRLMHHLMGEASRRGVKLLYGDVLPSNHNMLGFCQALGFQVGSCARDERLCRLEFDLSKSMPKATSDQRDEATGIASLVKIKKTTRPNLRSLS